MKKSENNHMKILFVEDIPTDVELAKHELEKGGLVFTSVTVETQSEFLQQLQEFNPDIIISDYALPEFDGMTALKLSQRYAEKIPFIMLTGSMNEETAVECMKQGAIDYVIKEHLARLPLSILEALRKTQISIEKEKAEAMLQESEARFRRLAENAQDLIYRFDFIPKRSFTYVSPIVLKMVGYTSQEFYDDPDIGFKLVYPDDRSILESFVKNESDYTIPIEVRWIKKDGNIIWVEQRNVPIYDDEEKLIALEGIARDITERKKAEAELKTNEEKYRSIFENVQDVYYEASINGIILEISPSIEIMTKGQYKREDLIGKSMYDFYNDAKQRQLLLEQLQKQNAVSDFEITLRNRNGSLSTCSIVSKICLDANGLPKKIIGSMRDITERKETGERARQFYSIVEESLNEIYIFDAETFKFTQANQAALHNMGYTLEEIKKLTPVDIKPDYNYRSFKQLIEPLLSGSKKKIMFQTRHQRKDKSFYPVEVHLQSSIFESRNVFVAFILDITEKQKLQNQLLQTQKVQSIGTLAGGIAHDFNNILGIILAYISTLERSEGNKEKIKKSITAITQAVNRGSALTRQILTFARQTGMSIGTISIPELIREMLAMLKETFPPTIEFRCDIQKDLPFINADNTQMHQVFLNLFVNSRDAMPKGGIITITARIVSIASIVQKFPDANSNCYISISITDTGKGMDEETKSRIFDPFFTTKDKGQGTGLGLSVVYGIIQSHHGFISFESEIGKGTTFNLFLPAPQDPNIDEELIKIKGSQIVGGVETLLFAEDEELLRDIVQSTLKANGYKVLIATDGREAVDIYRSHFKEISLVITDMGLPKLTGLDEYSLMRKINPAVKAIFASGFITVDARSELLNEGVKGFIQKPYIMDEVLRMIRDVLDEK